MASIPSGPRALAAIVPALAAAIFLPAAAASAATPTSGPSAAAPPAAASTASITMSGTVTDARAGRVSGGVTYVPSSTPPVAGAQVMVNGHPAATTTSSGAFAFTYADPGNAAVTVTVSAPGFGAYRLAGVTTAQSGDTLTVALTSSQQSIDDSGARPGSAQSGNRAAPAGSAASARGKATTGAASAATAGPAATASSCGGYDSDTAPPSTIRVLEFSQHTSSGAPVPGSESGVYSVAFETYVEDVLPNEWIASWDPASLEAGAMAVKTYGWYWANSNGGTWNGTCYNVDDSTDFQRYIPGQSAAATNTAIINTWDSIMTESGSIFEASYQATLTGNDSEACGSGLSNYPNTLSQWGSENCALDGDSWRQILSTYYPGISISGSDGGTSTASSPVASSSDGMYVSFAESGGVVAHDWNYGDGTGWHGPYALGGTARADSPVVSSADGMFVTFIDTSGNVVHDWKDANGWHGPFALGGTARAGSGLAVSSDGMYVSFTEPNGAVAHDWNYGDGTGWQGPYALGGTARADSPVASSADGMYVSFIDASGNVAHDWKDANGWHGPFDLGGTAKAGSGLASSSDGMYVSFIQPNGAVAHDWNYGDGTGWQGPYALGGTARADSPVASSADGAFVSFIDASGNVAHDWKDANGWHGPFDLGGTAKAGSGLASSSDGAYVSFIDPGGNVAHDWKDANGWHGPFDLGGTSR